MRYRVAHRRAATQSGLTQVLGRTNTSMETLDPLFKFVGGIVLAGGGISLIVYQIFKHLASKWLDSKFDERLQALRHLHGKEIEQLKFRISTLLDRATKLHQREFDILPEAWSKLNDAFWATRGFVHPMQSFPNIDRMSGPQQASFIAACKLLDWQKVELSTAKDKNKDYQDKIFWHRLAEIQDKDREAYTFVVKNGIFINEEIRLKFSAIHDLVWNSLTEHKMNQEHNIRPLQREKIGKLLAEGEDQMKELERLVHVRLWPAESAP